jgi:hypothetical protein
VDDVEDVDEVLLVDEDEVEVALVSLPSSRPRMA